MKDIIEKYMRIKKNHNQTYDKELIMIVLQGQSVFPALKK